MTCEKHRNSRWSFKVIVILKMTFKIYCGNIDDLLSFNVIMTFLMTNQCHYDIIYNFSAVVTF